MGVTVGRAKPCQIGQTGPNKDNQGFLRQSGRLSGLTKPILTNFFLQ
jgi:hypothetical protein